MRLFLLPKDFKGQSPYTIEGKDAHYLSSVLRLKPGMQLTARDADAQIWNLTVLSFGRNTCTVKAEKAQQAQETTDSLPVTTDIKSIILFQCITKAKKLEQIVRQATEIGVSEIVLVQSRYSTREAYKTERLDAQIKEAIQQSGSMVPTKLTGPLDIEKVPQYWANRGKALFFHQSETEKQQTLGDIVAQLSSPVAVLIGAEGGLSEDECSLLLENNFTPVLLETNILRAETAAVYALGAVQTAVQKNASRN